MNITGIRLKKFNGDSPTKAVASVTIDDALVVHDIKVIEGKNGLFVAMPSKKVGDRFVDVSHPITANSRSTLFSAILEEYRRMA